MQDEDSCTNVNGGRSVQLVEDAGSRWIRPRSSTVGESLQCAKQWLSRRKGLPGQATRQTEANHCGQLQSWSSGSDIGSYGSLLSLYGQDNSSRQPQVIPVLVVGKEKTGKSALIQRLLQHWRQLGQDTTFKSIGTK